MSTVDLVADGGGKVVDVPPLNAHVDLPRVHGPATGRLRAAAAVRDAGAPGYARQEVQLVRLEVAPACLRRPEIDPAIGAQRDTLQMGRSAAARGPERHLRAD